MFSIFSYIMSRVTHSEPGLPMMRLANLRNYMFMLLRLTADRSLKLTIRGMPQENLNNIILFPAFYPQYKFPYCTSKILNC